MQSAGREDAIVDSTRGAPAVNAAPEERAGATAPARRGRRPFLSRALGRLGSVVAAGVGLAVLLLLLAGLSTLLRAQYEASLWLPGAAPSALPRGQNEAGASLAGIASPAAATAVAEVHAPLPASASSAESPFVVYALGSPDGIEPGPLVAMELPSGRVLGRFEDVRRQGGGFAVAPDGRRGYLLDGPYLHELELPTLRRTRSAELPNSINILGHGRVVAVSPDGSEVYVQTWRQTGPTRIDRQRGIGQPDGDYGVAVFDVAQGTFTRAITLDPPWCGVADLFPLPEARLAVVCKTIASVRLVDLRAGKQVAAVEGLYGANSVASLDGRRLWVLARTGQLQEVDLLRLAITRAVNLAGDPARCGWPCVPFQQLHLSADGARLYVRAAPGRPELPSTGHATVAWVVDTTTLQRVAEVPLPAPAFDMVPLPDGRALLTSNTNTLDPETRATRLVEVPSGRELARWPGSIVGLQVHPPVAAAPLPAPADRSIPSATAVVQPTPARTAAPTEPAPPSSPPPTATPRTASPAPAPGALAGPTVAGLTPAPAVQPCPRDARDTAEDVVRCENPHRGRTSVEPIPRP